ncbi:MULTISPECIES: YdgA family protein [unclassified Pseudomonas]|uniref:YdgA family protein n=1 Tax=unclassified Pseudomonas TaxID=196821 RepID=UPI001EFC1536|nr:MULTISPECIES: YdgA family protein [unclassified Pseudomonas]MCG8908381.1 YdgA family protein [Pseudomonas sp. DP-17]MDU4250107.1 YdgA family protein [Pseudomonas sp.]
MKKTALAIAIPVAIVGAAVAGAWYTGSRVEQEVNRGITEANQLFEQEAPGLGAHLTLVDIQRGVLSSTARYNLSFTGKEGEEPQVLVFTDRLEHGPFPASRLAAGQLAPVMAQSHFALEQNELTAPLFTAAGGKAPLSGELTIHYDQKQEGRVETAALEFAKDSDKLRLSPAKVTFSVSADKKDVSAVGNLAEVDLDFTDENTGQPARVQLRDLGMQGDKKENANGFALGPSSATIKSLNIKSPGAPEVELREAVVEETLKQGGKGLDQSVSYRIGKVVVQGQEIGGMKLDLSLRNLDEGVLKTFKESYNKMALDSLESTELTPAQEEELKRLGLALLEGSPVLSLDELSLQTSHGVAKASLSVDLRKPNAAAATPDEMARSILAALKADLKVDKAVIGDIVALQGSLGGEAAGSVDPVALKQQSDAMTDLFSGMALNSQWAVLDGNALSSSLAYANDQVKFNGKDMSVPEFMAFAMGSAQGLGLGGPAAGGEEEPQEESLQ